VTESLRKKQQLIEIIGNERDRVTEQVAQWQRRKGQIARCPETELFDEVLQKVTDAIQEFLDDEAQLRKYLESSPCSPRCSPALPDGNGYRMRSTLLTTTVSERDIRNGPQAVVMTAGWRCRLNSRPTCWRRSRKS